MFENYTDGWTGSQCQTPNSYLNPCAASVNPCLNGASCKIYSCKIQKLFILSCNI